MSIQIGTITEVDNKKALARVEVDGRVTDWLPIISMSSKFKRHFTPIRIKDQVMVLNPFGSNENGFILRGVFFKDVDVPIGAEDDIEIIEYEDGTILKFDIKNKLVSIDTPNSFKLNVGGNIDITAGGKITINGSEIYLN
jgi:phage baseplate assembly protein V